MRIGAIFVALCTVLIAGSAGAFVYFAFGFDRAEAAMVTIAALMALGLYNVISARLGVRTAVGSQTASLSRGNADLARQIVELEHKLAALEQQVGTALDQSRATTDPLMLEIGELSTLLRQLAETVDTHETKLVGLARLQDATKPAAAPVARPEPSPPAPAVAPPSPATVVASPPKADAPSPSSILATISTAIEANRIDLYLQPIVTLPQRKVRYYEAMTRLRADNGDVLPAANFVAPAEAAGLMPKIDNLAIFRCVQVVRRLQIKNREIGLFCNLSGSTLADNAVFPQLLDFLDANRAIAPSLVLEFTQSALRAIGPMENESLAALAERGFRFSLDNVTDLRFEPRELAARGFRFIKVPANLLLNRTGPTLSDIHPADLPGLVARFGLDLIAEKIESEGAVVDLLDFDVKFGQGYLFSLPRPVRADALQGIAERTDEIAPAAGAVAATTSDADAVQTPSEVIGSSRRASAFAQLARRI